MKNKLPLVFISTLVASVAHAKSESLIFPSDEECRAVYTELKDSITPHQLSELYEMSSSAIGYSAFRYLTGRDSIFIDLKKQYGETVYSNTLDEIKKKLDDDQVKYWTEFGRYKESILAKRKKKFLGGNPGLGAKAHKITICNAALVYRNVNVDASTYASITKINPRAGRFGHFDISVKSCSIGSLVGTKNKYSEPSQWEGSRFVVLDARFRNVDKEGRLPSEGSLIIKTSSGDELRYDNTETIMQEGYGIYFKSVNPLVTMPTKIVYRIPTEIEGEILWEPGRNDEGKRLWCAFVSPEN